MRALVLNGKPVWLDSEQYAAKVRVRYRRWLVRRGVSAELVRGISSLSELRRLAVIVAAPRPLVCIDETPESDLRAAWEQLKRDS